MTAQLKLEFDPPSPRHRPKTAMVMIELMLEVEQLRDENQHLRAVLTGGDPPQSPFPLLSGEEVIRILHPNGYGKRGARR